MQSLSLASLEQRGELRIVLEGGAPSAREGIAFVFRRFFAYRNLPEEYRTALWNDQPMDTGLGWTRVVVDSPWLDELLHSEPLFALHGGKNATHYLFCTEDDVIDVLAAEPPEFEKLGCFDGSQK